MGFQLDNDSRCAFCGLHYETLIHVLCKCAKLNIIWDFLDEVLAIMNINYSFFNKRTLLQEFEVMHIKCGRNDVKIVLYLTTIVNYHLWKARNKCVHEQYVFNCADIVSSLIKSIAARKRLQTYVSNNNLKINRIGEILSNMILLKNITFSIDNG